LEILKQVQDDGLYNLISLISNLKLSTGGLKKYICIDILKNICIIICMRFEWDDEKNCDNIEKHGLDFYIAQKAFFDASRIILKDVTHSQDEDRYFCIGETGTGIATVRFTMRNKTIRIFGAGYWRKGKKLYEEQH
jgi:uncharacterized DUF497 family protein